MTVAGGTAECGYAAPMAGGFVDLNYAYGVDQAILLDNWLWVGAHRLTYGQRTLLGAMDMAYGTQFLRSRPRRWSDRDAAVLRGTVGHPANRVIWPEGEAAPPYWRARMRNMDVTHDWIPAPMSDEERFREAGRTSRPVVYLPSLDELGIYP